MNIHPEEILGLIEKSFPYVCLTGDNGKLLYASRMLLSECGMESGGIEEKDIYSLSARNSADRISAAMRDARDAGKAKATIVLAGTTSRFMELNVNHIKGKDGEFFVFFGSHGITLSAASEWEKNERIKELSCIYAVSELIETSRTVQNFFADLPKCLCQGMCHPEQALVYSIYQGQEYGNKERIVKYIKTDIIVSSQNAGEIRVGYDRDDCGLLPEEQKMMDEIARVLNIALERKSLRDNLVVKQKEETELKERLGEMEKEIDARKQETEEQRRKLSAVNSYLSRINHDWEESKTRLATIFEAIPDKVALIDNQRNVVMTNRKNVPVGDKCYHTFFSKDVPCKDCRLSKIAKEKTPIALEISHEGIFYEVNALPIFNAGHEVEGIIEFYRDITLEKTYEQQLQQADKLASLGQLVSGIGHEINNPNQFIRGNIKIIQQAFEGILPIIDEYYAGHPDLKIARLKYAFFREHIMTLMNDMAHGSERIKAIVDGLKRFARRDEGLLIDSVDVNTIIDTASRLVYNEVHKFADLILNLTPAIPVITGNSQKIEQVIVNLFINAGQAMPEGRRGSIHVATRAEEGNVIIEVTDNGKGMGEQTLKRIFDPFFTTRRAGGGTGLGLAIAHRIIEEHRGGISVTSKLDAGTTFKITLPVKPAQTPV